MFNKLPKHSCSVDKFNSQLHKHLRNISDLSRQHGYNNSLDGGDCLNGGVFNMQEKEEKTDREQVLDMIGDMGVRVREEEVVDVVRMRKKEGVGLARPIIVEFKSEYDKWTVLRNKSDLREMNVHKKFF